MSDEEIVKAASEFIDDYFADDSYGWDDYDEALKRLRNLVYARRVDALIRMVS